MHGLLVPDMVVVDDNKRAHLIYCDTSLWEFSIGISSIQERESKAPELQDLRTYDSDIKPTFEGDIYAFAHVCIWVSESVIFNILSSSNQLSQVLYATPHLIFGTG